MRDRIEVLLSSWGHFAYRRAWFVIIAVFALTAVSATQLRHFYIDASLERFFHDDDPIRVTYDDFRDQFGRDTFVIISLEPRGGVFNAPFLEELRQIHEELESEVPLLVETTSLVNIRETRGVADGLVVGDFMEDWPETEAEIETLKRRALANPLYANNIISANGRVVAIILETEVYSTLGRSEDALEGFDDELTDAAIDGDESGDAEEPAFLTGAEDRQIVEAVLAVLDRHRSDDLTIQLAGTPVLTDRFAFMMQRDMMRFTALAITLIFVFLSVLFRRVGAVILPLVTVICSVVFTLSVMAATGTPLTSPTQIIPTFLLAVGVGGSVHILTIYYQARRRGDNKEDGIAYALGHSGLAVIMTSLTTAGGLLSFIAAELAPISHFGIFAPIGVMAALFYTLTLLPALMAVSPGRSAAGAESRPKFWSQLALVRVGTWATRNPVPVVGVWGAIIVVALFGTMGLRMAHSPLEWFPEGDLVREGMHAMNTKMGGMGSLELIIEAPGENGFHDPTMLVHLDEIQTYTLGLRINGIEAGKALSLVDIVKETNQALNENRPAFYTVPDDRLLIAQELLLFENAGSDDVEDLVDPLFDKGRVSFRMPMDDAILYPEFIGAVLDEARTRLGPGYKVEVTGIIHVISATMAALMNTMVRSYIIALAIITPLMILLIGNIRIGLLAMVPNLTPVVFTLGLMGWTDIPLDAFTLLIGSIAIGLAVDDTIHFMHNFRRYFEQSGDVYAAVRQTLETTGQALLFTSLVLSAGFAIYTQAYLTNLFYFGLLTSVTIVVAFLADLILAPALLVWAFADKRPSEPTA